MDKNEHIKASDLYEFRSELMDMFLYLCNYNDFNKLTLLTISETIDKIYGKYESRPLADVVEVVRCKDCKHQEQCCEFIMISGKDKNIDFCSYGERKDVSKMEITTDGGKVK